MTKKITVFDFNRRKYGQELLIDVVDIDWMSRGFKTKATYSCNFFCILVFTDGEENVSVNGETITVKPGTVACSRPGEVWKWNENAKVKGLNLLFVEEFLLSFFNDSLFLAKFPFLQADRQSPFLQLDGEAFERIILLYKTIHEEIKNQQDNADQHYLRAMLYETLMLFNRVRQLRPDISYILNSATILSCFFYKYLSNKMLLRIWSCRKIHLS